MVTENALYIVALPIGNYSDISERALKTLENVDCIAAEDTRNLRTLAQFFRINLKQVVAHHNHNEQASLPGIINLLEEGKSVALVSDAGTPNISDPGFRLAKTCIEKNIPVIPLPGASALTTLLSVCPIGGADHYFCAFLPNKESERIKKLESLAAIKDHCSRAVFFESPHRLRDCLKNISDTLGDIDCFVGRELTKQYESFYYSPASQMNERIPDSELKGEFVVCIDLKGISTGPNAVSIDDEIKKLLDQGKRTKEIQKALQKKTELSSKELYDKIEEIKNS